MATIVLKNVPIKLHRRLKEEAERNRRSMAQQALTILEGALPVIPPVVLPTPVKTRRRITRQMVLDAIHAGRK